MRKLYIETLGCAMNVRDSEHIIAELTEKEGFQLVEDPKEADLLLINTCSVREKPVHKLFSEIGYLNKIKREGAKIGVCGCTASHLGEEIIKRAPYVSFVLGARNVSKIRDVLEREGAVEVDIDHDESQYAFSDYRSSPYKALINISIGCDKRCTFCIVPYTRGDEISIPPELIVREVERAVAGGAKEIFLLGQNVNNYGRRFSDRERKIDFTDLLKMVSEVDGVERIRFTSPHPLHMDDRFLQEFATNPKICKSMHMPLQSGSTRILRRMKRGYTKEWFLDRAQRLREMVPTVRISTDIIVGFPGEEERDFEETIEVVRKVQFEQIFSFKYSPRPLTPAREYRDQVPDEVAGRRLSLLQELHLQMLDEISEREMGKIHQVYFDELKPGGYVAGRSDNNWIVKVKGSEELLGEMRAVRITKTGRLALEGEPVA
ncbi:MAG: tRNA (N6-isopentenyl adenosine(37)-C2)-methylthiotransferase MiaB [Epsilonproteobacteria bacterium]|nr:tRNA (N6-isopentenyl adenosine(37)-C2)-methylthiotransferase MiaB [Campylobacterota bacterium]NPA56825.1 tRNA (N6-isopentenyl adenosine(37)-C2)-methylthiotransferase MiaB [Campylobacterota bacterium]